MEIKPRLTIRRSSPIREKVRQAIRNDILDGRIPPGARLVEGRLARQIGVSRTPVREALHMLEIEGLLESAPRVGYRVCELNWSELEQICEIRAVNESLAARWAMQRIRPRQLTALDRNVAAMKADADRGDAQTFFGLDAEFHEIIARASGSTRLLELCQLLRRHMLRYRIESLHLRRADFRTMARNTVCGHCRILESIREKDEQAVNQAVRRHLDETKVAICKHAMQGRASGDLPTGK